MLNKEEIKTIANLVLKKKNTKTFLRWIMKALNAINENQKNNYVDFLKNLVKRISVENEYGYIDFLFALELEKTETHEKIIKGMMIKMDGIFENHFTAHVLILTNDLNETDIEKAQSSDFVEIDLTYEHLYLVTEGLENVNSYAEISIVDLFTILKNEEMIKKNLQHIYKNPEGIYKLI